MTFNEQREFPFPSVFGDATMHLSKFAYTTQCFYFNLSIFIGKYNKVEEESTPNMERRTYEFFSERHKLK